MSVLKATKKVRAFQVNNTLKKRPDKLPWPRNAADDPSVTIGVDVVQKKKDITKIVHKFFKVDGYDMDELIQEVITAIIHKNYTRSAHDPRKSSFGHYVYMVANNVCINIVHKKRRYDRESESIDSTPCGQEEGRSIIETYSSDDHKLADEVDVLVELEDILRNQKEWDLARYVRAVRTGANPDVVREALSWDDKKVTSKNIRDFRYRIEVLVSRFS